MEEASDVGSRLSSNSTASMSVKEPPSRLYREYQPLTEVYRDHGQPLPLSVTGIKDSNSEAIMKALKSLQDKIHHLELERAATADRFKQLSEETGLKAPYGNHGNHTKGGERDTDTSTSESEAEIPPIKTTPTKRSTRDYTAAGRLESLDTRYSLQSRELDLLKERLKQVSVTGGGGKDLHTGSSPVKPSLRMSRSPLKETEERLQLLEDKQEQLQAKQQSTSSKLNNLQGKLLQKQWKKRRAQSGISPQISDENQLPSGRRKKTTVGRKKSSPHQSHDLHLSKPIPGIHYHLNIKDVPFVVGTSTTPSHSVSANYQKVVSLMKYHNPLLCGAAAANTVPKTTRRTSPRCAGTKKRRHCTTGPSTDELEGLLIALEAEFGRLTFEHQELATILQQEPQGTQSTEARAEIEAELSQVIDQLEGKMEQIQVVKKLLNDHKRRRQQQDKPVRRRPRGHSPIALSTSNLEQPVTAAATGTRRSCCSTVGVSGTEDSLQVLRKMKKLQSTLQRDDLSWK